jgi:hypothetical protein
MRFIPFFSIALMLSVSGFLFAQEWIEFASREDRFTCNFPSQPKVTATTYKSERGADLPARIYSVTQGQSRYSVTVVDYNPIEKILTEKAKDLSGRRRTMPRRRRRRHRTLEERSSRSSYVCFLAIDAEGRKVTSFVWNHVDLVEGNQLQLTNNADKSRTFAGIYMHENKLYIIEGTVPAGYPEPGLFQQSLGWLDANGLGLRYQNYYSNNYPAPPPVGRAGQAQTQGRIDAGPASPQR